MTHRTILLQYFPWTFVRVWQWFLRVGARSRAFKFFKRVWVKPRFWWWNWWRMCTKFAIWMVDFSKFAFQCYTSHTILYPLRVQWLYWQVQTCNQALYLYSWFALSLENRLLFWISLAGTHFVHLYKLLTLFQKLVLSPWRFCYSKNTTLLETFRVPVETRFSHSSSISDVFMENNQSLKNLLLNVWSAARVWSKWVPTIT